MRRTVRGSMGAALRAGAVFGVGIGSAAALGDNQSINFEGYSLGSLITANNGYAGPDGRLPGQTDGANRWWNAGNAATQGSIVSGTSRFGTPSRMLACARTVSSPGLDGVIAGVTSPRNLDLAGESDVASLGGTVNTMVISFWWRTGPTSPVTQYRFGSEAWGINSTGGADRYTWNRAIEESGSLNYYSVGMINLDPDYFPPTDTLIASNLQWGRWYRTVITIDFNDTTPGTVGVPGPTDDNDVVTTRLYDVNGTLLGTGVDTTWESGSHYNLFGNIGNFPLDSIAFQARSFGGSPFQSFVGDVAYVDDLEINTFSTAQLTLVPVDSCVNAGENVVIDVVVSGANTPIVGGQFFLNYDNALLDFLSAQPGEPAAGQAGNPFSQEVFELVNEGAGQISYAVGVPTPPAAVGTTNTYTMARLTFAPLAGACTTNPATLISWRSNNPPTRLADEFDNELSVGVGNLALNALSSGPTIDLIAPVVSCPPDQLSVKSDAGFCSAVVNWGAATATDNCGSVGPINYAIDLNSDNVIDANQAGTSFNFPAGSHDVTASTTDTCGNVGSCTFNITVSDQSLLVVDLQLQPVVAPSITRCIEFTVGNGSSCVSFSQDILFTAGLASGVNVLMPCGAWNCISATDPLHTLARRDSDNFGVSGTNYVADFTDNIAGPNPGDMLLGGNLNNDGFIDILDFGLFATRFGVNYGTGNTPCTTPAPHADVTGNGLVDSGDFTFIQINFLQPAEAPCCGSFATAPTARASVRVDELAALGLEQIAAADLTGDGVIDQLDVAAYLADGIANRGDMNCDGVVGIGDIAGFVKALTNPAQYVASFPGCNVMNADINDDGAASVADIGVFVNLLTAQ